MIEQKNELVSLRLPERHKTYLQRLAVVEGLTMAQWLRKQVCIRYWEAIHNGAEHMAITQVAVECGVAFNEAIKLFTLNEAEKLIPIEEKEGFAERVKTVYEDNLKKMLEETGFMGLEEEIKQINALRVTREEWNESNETLPKNVTIIDNRKKKK